MSKPHPIKVIGLEYSRDQDIAPIVVIKSEATKLSMEILRLAKKYGIPVMHKPNVVSALSSVSIDKAIPEKLYKIVAVILKILEMR